MLPGWMKSAGKKAMNFVAGAADSYSFGASSWVLDNVGLSGIYDKCSTMFKAGSITADIVPLNGPFKATQVIRKASKISAVKSAAKASVPPKALPAAKKTQGVDLVLHYDTRTKTWTPDQRGQADIKVAGLNKLAGDGKLVKTKANRTGSNARDLLIAKLKGEGKVMSPGTDADHLHELQLGGLDDINNLWELDSSVNRGIGSQIYQQMKKYPLGTKVSSVTIK